MNDLCPTCGVSRKEFPANFFDNHEKCADCEYERELDLTDTCGLREIIGILRYDLKLIGQIVTPFPNNRLAALTEIKKITDRQYGPSTDGETIWLGDVPNEVFEN